MLELSAAFLFVLGLTAAFIALCGWIFASFFVGGLWCTTLYLFFPAIYMASRYFLPSWILWHTVVLVAGGFYVLIFTLEHWKTFAKPVMIGLFALGLLLSSFGIALTVPRGDMTFRDRIGQATGIAPYKVSKGLWRKSGFPFARRLGGMPNKPAEYSKAAFIHAVRVGDLRRVRALLAKGLNPNMRTAEGNTMLMEASVYGYDEIVKGLLDRGADLHAINPQGKTAVMLAEQNYHSSVAVLLKKETLVQPKVVQMPEPFQGKSATSAALQEGS